MLDERIAGEHSIFYIRRLLEMTGMKGSKGKTKVIVIGDDSFKLKVEI